MLAVTERKTYLFRLVLFALACVFLYHLLVERQASVLMEVHTTAPTKFKMYWLTDKDGIWSENNARKVYLRPGNSFYTFKLTDLANIAVFRIDPSEEKAQVTIRAITITQNGYAPIRIEGDAFSRITLGGGIESVRFADEGLIISPATHDPQLFFDLPGSLHKTAVLWSGDFLPLAALFVFVLFAGLALERFVNDRNTLIPACLAVVLTVITAMAAISSFSAHPDEEMHVRAGDYFQHHFLPPPVGAEEIKNTYSVYGVSRLHSGEIAYFFIGKFARAFQALAVPSFMVQRYFNIALWSVLLLLAFSYRDFRLLMVPLLLSPQIWYMFSYVNSEAFAVFIMMLTAYQVASPRSTWNRLLEVGPGIPRPKWYAFIGVGILFGLMLLVKKNFYFFLVFLVLYFLWRLVFAHTRLSRQAVYRITVVLLIGASLFAGVRGTDEYINGFQKSEKLLQARHQFAGELWNPGTPLEKRHAYLQMRDRGTSLKRLLMVDNWWTKSFLSAFGMYGFTSVSGSGTYYALIQYVGLLFLLVLSATVLLHGGLEGVSLWALTLGCAGALIGVALYHAWTVDFQPQGRYFLPIVGMFSVFFLHGQQYLFRSLLPLFCAGLFLLSLYSFIFVGLTGILKPL